jgi:hypothetical protein
MRKVAAGVATALLLAGLGATCVAIFRIDRSLTDVRKEVAGEGILALMLAPVSAITNAGFEPLAPANSFTNGASFDGKLYLAGPGGLAIYTEPGLQLNAQPRWLRTGLDLPPAPIVA